MGLIHIHETSYGSPTRRGNANTVTIGKYCGIAEGVVLDSGFGHNLSYISTYPFHRLRSDVKSNTVVTNDIYIGSDVWIGEDVMIMEGVIVSPGAVIGARSVVTRGTEIGPYEIWAGVPAKFIRKRFSDEIIEKLLKLKWWELSPEEVLEIAPILMSEDFDSLFKKYNI